MKPKGSTVIIAFMYLTWIAYLALQIWCYSTQFTFLPSEVTIATAGLFITETASLAALKMRKEGTKAPNSDNHHLSSIGASGSVFDSLIDETIEDSAKHARKE